MTMLRSTDHLHAAERDMLRPCSVQVFTSSSTLVFKIFACDTQAVEGESYLRADYGISCNTDKYTYFRIYAGVMIVVRRRIAKTRHFLNRFHGVGRAATTLSLVKTSGRQGCLSTVTDFIKRFPGRVPHRGQGRWWGAYEGGYSIGMLCSICDTSAILDRPFDRLLLGHCRCTPSASRSCTPSYSGLIAILSTREHKLTLSGTSTRQPRRTHLPGSLMIWRRDCGSGGRTRTWYPPCSYGKTSVRGAFGFRSLVADGMVQVVRCPEMLVCMPAAFLSC